MSKERFYKYLVFLLILIGGALRLSVYYVSPPNNSYDDHLEVISIYAEDFSRPTPFQCWECYQPPLYYYMGATILRTSKALGFRTFQSWKIVQALNPILSILVLLIAFQLLRLLKVRMKLIALILSFLVILPRDIFTSAMIGNDYILVFFSISSFYLFVRTLELIKRGQRYLLTFSLLVLSAFLGSVSKQHGLLLHLFPIALILVLVLRDRTNQVFVLASIFLLGAILSLSEEYWKYEKTGEVLVSNQQHFDYALNQYPGSIEKVELHTFKIFELFKDPFISETTSASLMSELFARTFFDYEWRFISPNRWSRNLGRIGLIVGLIWTIFFAYVIIHWLRIRLLVKLNIHEAVSLITPLTVALFFIVVPLLQTLRYPYFSSMKAMFMLSGVIMLILLIGSLTKENSGISRFCFPIITLNVIYGMCLVVSICLGIEISLNNLHGPLWPIPLQ